MKPFLNKQRSRVAGCLGDGERDGQLLARLWGSHRLRKGRICAKRRVGGSLLVHAGSGSQSTSPAPQSTKLQARSGLSAQSGTSSQIPFGFFLKPSLGITKCHRCQVLLVAEE